MISRRRLLGAVAGVSIAKIAKLRGSEAGMVRRLGAVEGPPQDLRNLGGKRAPLRNRLTKMPFSAGIQVAPGPQKLTTYLTVMSFEAPPSAIRIGVANPFSVAMTIVSASVWSTNAWGPCDFAYKRPSADIFVNPSGNATGQKFHTAFQGEDVDLVNDGNKYGRSRSLVLPANLGNASDTPSSYPIRWLDWAPAPPALARADGGKQPIFQIYVTLAAGPSSIAKVAPNLHLAAYNSSVSANRGRLIWAARAWDSGVDHSDNPTGTGWNGFGFGIPWIAIQYVPLKPGLQIVLNGDSLATSPSNDGMSWPLCRAAYALSSPQLPIEVANLGWGGTGADVYMQVLRRNAKALKPSIFAPQLISRNDGSTSLAMNVLRRRNFENFDFLVGSGAPDCRFLWNSAGCEPSFDGNDEATAAFVALRDQANSEAAAGGAPVIDGPEVVGNPTSPWDYAAGLSDDNTHPNDQGAAVITPLAIGALKAML